MRIFLILAIGLVCSASMVDAGKGKKGKGKDKDKGKKDSGSGSKAASGEDEFIEALIPLMMQVHDIVEKVLLK